MGLGGSGGLIVSTVRGFEANSSEIASGQVEEVRRREERRGREGRGEWRGGKEGRSCPSLSSNH